MRSSKVDSKDIGKIVKKCRLSKGWTQGDLAQYLGIDQSTISRTEKGVKPRRKNIILFNKFISEVEGIEEDLLNKVLSAVRSSSELEALITRIIIEQNA